MNKIDPVSIGQKIFCVTASRRFTTLKAIVVMTPAYTLTGSRISGGMPGQSHHKNPARNPTNGNTHHGWLRNVKPPSLSLPAMKYWDLDPERRAALRLAWNQPVRWPAYALAGVALLGLALSLRRR